jgi:hypothetical protein
MPRKKSIQFKNKLLQKYIIRHISVELSSKCESSVVNDNMQSCELPLINSSLSPDSSKITQLLQTVFLLITVSLLMLFKAN